MAVWAVRPHLKSVVRLAVRRVRHLLDLRVALMELMLEDFTLGVDVYLSVLRDASSIELKQTRVGSLLSVFYLCVYYYSFRQKYSCINE